MSPAPLVSAPGGASRRYCGAPRGDCVAASGPASRGAAPAAAPTAGPGAAGTLAGRCRAHRFGARDLCWRPHVASGLSSVCVGGRWFGQTRGQPATLDGPRGSARATAFGVPPAVSRLLFGYARPATDIRVLTSVRAALVDGASTCLAGGQVR